jgi:hypothetical protein
VIHRSGVGLRDRETPAASSRARTLPGTTEFDYPGAVTPDNQTLVLLRNLHHELRSAGRAVLEPRQARPFAQTPAYEGGGRLSADGKWLVYVSNESGRNQVYVRSFPDGDRRLQVSTDGGTQPALKRQGAEIFYRNGDRMMAVELRADRRRRRAEPTQDAVRARRIPTGRASRSPTTT